MSHTPPDSVLSGCFGVRDARVNRFCLAKAVRKADGCALTNFGEAMSIAERKRRMIWGSLVADAATMGFHWLYDQDRIRALAPKAPEFRAPDPSDFEGVPGYFAHGARRAGEFSQYGEQALVMLRACAAPEGYSNTTYAQKFREHFGYGGAYVGYIDRPTRDTLNNMTRFEQAAQSACRAVDPAVDDQTHNAIMAKVLSNRAMQSGAALREALFGAVKRSYDDDALVDYAVKLSEAVDENSPPPGADDVQLPAVSKLPVLVALHYDAPDLPSMVEDAVRVTNNSDEAVRYGQVVALLLKETIKTGVLPDLGALVDAAPGDVGDALNKGLTRLEDTTEAVTADIGMICNLDTGLPSVVHNLSRAPSFEDGVRTNIYAGGDNCGRSIILGAVLGVMYGVPEDWTAQLLQRDTVAGLLKDVGLS